MYGAMHGGRRGKRGSLLNNPQSCKAGSVGAGGDAQSIPPPHLLLYGIPLGGQVP